MQEVDFHNLRNSLLFNELGRPGRYEENSFKMRENVCESVENRVYYICGNDVPRGAPGRNMARVSRPSAILGWLNGCHAHTRNFGSTLSLDFVDTVVGAFPFMVSRHVPKRNFLFRLHPFMGAWWSHVWTTETAGRARRSWTGLSQQNGSAISKFGTLLNAAAATD